MSRIILVALLAASAGMAAQAASPAQLDPPAMLETSDQAYAFALRHAIGAPARADLAGRVVPKSAPRGPDSEITFHAIGFGRDGYIELSVGKSVQKAGAVERFITAFLNGLNFVPGKAYGDVQPSDTRSAAGLAGATGLDSLRKAEFATAFWTSDTMVPVVGSVVAAIGAMGLVIYVYHHMRRLRRRV